jgi:hypothetical protein
LMLFLKISYRQFVYLLLGSWGRDGVCMFRLYRNCPKIQESNFRRRFLYMKKNYSTYYAKKNNKTIQIYSDYKKPKKTYSTPGVFGFILFLLKFVYKIPIFLFRL